MSGYVEYRDEAEEVFRTHERHRQHLFSAIRGWLRNKSSPRWTVAGLFAVCLIPGGGVAWFASKHGVNQYGPAQALGLLAAWLVFIFLIRWRAAIVSRSVDLGDDWRMFMAVDDGAEANENRELDPKMQKSISDGIRSGLQQGPQGAGLLVVGIITLGTWLIWDLIRNGPTLLAETVIDGELVPRYPALARQIPSDHWLKNAFIMTCVHFLGLSVAAWTLGFIISCFMPPPH